MLRTLVLPGLLFVTACAHAQSLPVFGSGTVSPMPIVILETDMGGDSDDAAVLGFFHHLADAREIRLLAVMHNGNNEWGGAAISAINTYYGRPELPIGTYRTAAEAGRPAYHPLVDRSRPNGPRRALSYTGPTTAGRWAQVLAETYPCSYRSRRQFPDAVEVYREVLAGVPNDSVVIVNTGYLGNLSNLLAWIEVDTGLRALFTGKVHRMTGAVGGSNTCASVFPAGLAEHVVNNPIHPMPVLTWLGGPPPNAPPYNGPSLMSVDAQFGARLAIDNPVRESYRFKTELEHGNRGTSLAWHWHMFDAVIGFSTVGWDEFTDSAGLPYYTLLPPEWVDVIDNCGAVGIPGPSPVPNWQFQGVGVRATHGRTMTDVVSGIRQRILDDGLYVGPARQWSPEREHLSVTAMFEDGTLGGFVPNRPVNPFDFGFENGRLVVPTVSRAAGRNEAAFVTEGRRYADQTVMLRVARLPDVTKFPPAETSPAVIDIAFWGDTSAQMFGGQAPLLRLLSWPGRGWVDPADPTSPASPGQPVLRAEVWDLTPQGFSRLARHDFTSVGLGEEFVLRLEISAGRAQCALNGIEAFAAPVSLVSSPPADGGMTEIRFGASVADDRFDIDWALIRPRAGSAVIPDVHVDHAGDVWFSLVRNGDLARDLFGGGGGASTHHVEVELAPRPGLPTGQPIRIAFAQWFPLALSHETHGIGTDHWVYGLRGIGWETGDEFVLEYRGIREGEQVPPR